jgi:hypothetical protein
VTPEGVAAFNRTWPGSKLRETRSYWFEFGIGAEVADWDVPQQDEGPEAEALADDCAAWLFSDDEPSWAK